MAKRQVTLTFNEETIADPIIYNLAQEFNVVTNIRRAELRDEGGWILVELDGEERGIEDGIAWVISRGVRVDPSG